MKISSPNGDTPDFKRYDFEGFLHDYVKPLLGEQWPIPGLNQIIKVSVTFGSGQVLEFEPDEVLSCPHCGSTDIRDRDVFFRCETCNRRFGEIEP